MIVLMRYCLFDGLGFLVCWLFDGLFNSVVYYIVVSVIGLLAAGFGLLLIVCLVMMVIFVIDCMLELLELLFECCWWFCG